MKTIKERRDPTGVKFWKHLFKVHRYKLESWKNPFGKDHGFVKKRDDVVTRVVTAESCLLQDVEGGICSNYNFLLDILGME